VSATKGEKYKLFAFFPAVQKLSTVPYIFHSGRTSHTEPQFFYIRWHFVYDAFDLKLLQTNTLRLTGHISPPHWQPVLHETIHLHNFYLIKYLIF